MIFFLVVILVVSAAVAIIGAIITALVARINRKRKILLALVSPFLFSVSWFFLTLIGMSVVAEWKGVDIGIGDSWYVRIDGDYALSMIDGTESGFIDFKGDQLQSDVRNLQQSGEKIYGSTDTGKYFSIDMKTSKISEYTREKDFLDNENLNNHTFSPESVGDYYNRRSSELAGYWMMAACVASLLASAVLVLVTCRFALFGRTLGLSRRY